MQPIKEQITKLINTLKYYEVEKLMKISPKLAEEVFAKYNNFDPNKYDNSNAKAAIFTFNGDVYKGLEADTLNSKTI